MGAYIVRRLWQMLPTMLGVILLVFFLFNWVGGDPAYVLAGKISNQEQIDNIRRQLGVDQPYWCSCGSSSSRSSRPISARAGARTSACRTSC
jgi:ABC-type dipeptide/oligopeptide/nickel transport system permease component